MKEENVIEVNQLTKTFGDFTAVNAISFEVKKGEIFGFLGANGAGKTTAIKMLIGISKPSLERRSSWYSTREIANPNSLEGPRKSLRPLNLLKAVSMFF